MGLGVSGDSNQPVNLWTMPTLAGIGVLSGQFSCWKDGWSPSIQAYKCWKCSPGDFRAESKTVLGKAQSPRVKASQGFYCSGCAKGKTTTTTGPSWVKLNIHEWKRLRGFTAGVLFTQTNKQTNKGFYSTKQTNKQTNLLHYGVPAIIRCVWALYAFPGSCSCSCWSCRTQSVYL